MASRSWINRSAGFSSPPSRGVSYLECSMHRDRLAAYNGGRMRHSYAGLAITSFPYSHPAGYWIPPAFDFKIAIHFAHRIGAILSAAILAYRSGHSGSLGLESDEALGSFSRGPPLGIQVYLGALTIWTVRNPHVATFHMLNGAFLLAVCWMMTLRSLKFRLDAPVVSTSASKNLRSSETLKPQNRHEPQESNSLTTANELIVPSSSKAISWSGYYELTKPA